MTDTISREAQERIIVTNGDGLEANLRHLTALADPVVVRDANGDMAALQYVLPNGYSLHTHDLSKFQPRPARKTGKVTVEDADSFLNYVATHGEPGTTLYADPQSAAVTAILNAATRDDAGWADHICTLRLRRTPEWMRWFSVSDTWQTQEDFAEFVEESSRDFRTPTSGYMMEVAQTFEAKMGADFETGVRLDNGTRQLVYKETVTARAGQGGTLDVPTNLILGLAPYVGGPGFNVEARLRFKIVSGTLHLMVKIDRLDEYTDQAFTQTIDGLRSSLAETIDGLLTVTGHQG